MTVYKARVYECDNPDCRKTVPDTEPMIEAAQGFHFRGILHIHPGGGDSFGDDLFACSPECLGPALQQGYQRYTHPRHYDDGFDPVGVDGDD